MSGQTFSNLLPPLLLSLLLVAAQETPIRYCKLFDVKNYGAVADGKTDSAKSLKFSFVRNATIQRITSINSKNVHMQIFACKNLKLDSVRLIAPGDSPNTDGIHLGESSNIEISSSIINTGDDCISIGPGTTNLTVSNVSCGPRHGISIGSLCGGRNEGDIAGIAVRNCTFVGTQNGIRIKTWAESPTSSAAHDLTFEDLIMTDVENPIVIDQKYCPHNLCGNKNPSLVKISNVKFRNILRDAKTKNAIYLLCSDAVPCEGVELSNIDLRYKGLGDAAIASCVNVRGQTLGSVFPPSCI